MDKTTPMKPKPLVNATCKLGKKGCFDDGRCHALGNCENKIVTNADRIRAMSDEELVKFLLKVNTAYAEPCMTGEGVCKWEDYPTHDKGCKDCFMEWLQSEAEGPHD